MKKFIKIVFAILFVFSLCVKATDMTFTSSGTITDGNVFDNVYVQNDGTVVNMSGGQIGHLLSWDASIFNMTGGLIFGQITIAPISTFNISDDGTIDIFDFVVDTGASVNISDGNISADRLKTYPASLVTPASIVNITGGNLNFGNFTILGGTLNIYRGLLNVDDVFGIDNSATVNIFGHDFNYSQSVLTGYLLDNNFFTIKGINASEYARFNLIPEPVSVLFFSFGLLALRKQK
jgi:hypothetical protein